MLQFQFSALPLELIEATSYTGDFSLCVRHGDVDHLLHVGSFLNCLFQNLRHWHLDSLLLHSFIRGHFVHLMLAYGEAAALNPTVRLPQPSVFLGVKDPDLVNKTQSAANADDFAQFPVLVEAKVADLRLGDVVHRRSKFVQEKLNHRPEGPRPPQLW